MPTDYTPAGGTRAVATWTDADGNVCAPVDAVHAEIIEYDADGFELARTYMEPLEPGQVEVASNERMSEVHTPLLSWDIAPALRSYRFSASEQHRLGLLQIELGAAQIDFDGRGVVEVIEDLHGWLERIDGDVLTAAVLQKQSEPMVGDLSFGQAALEVLKEWAIGD
jgi:hypothetical protein